MGSSALAVLVSFNNQVERTGGRVIFTNLTEPVRDCFSFMKIDLVLQIVPDEPAGIAALKL